MSKFSERNLRLRKERIDLFGDGSGVTAVISRPGRRPFTYREHVAGIASDVATANPPKLCFDPSCQNEVHSLDNVFMFVATADEEVAPMGMAACDTCAKKSDEELLQILRTIFASRFGIDQAKPTDRAASLLVEDSCINFTVRGFQLAVIGGRATPCPVAEIFSQILESRQLPRFAFVFRGHNNCFAITKQLYLDFKDLGIEDRFTYKIGFSAILKSDGEPIGPHSWIECDGWVIDGSSGAFGNPIMFQRVQDYYSKREMKDIKDADFAATA